MNKNKVICIIIENNLKDNYFELDNYQQGRIMGIILNKINTELNCAIHSIYYNNNIIKFIYIIESVINNKLCTKEFLFNYNLKSLNRNKKIERLKSLI